MDISKIEFKDKNDKIIPFKENYNITFRPSVYGIVQNSKNETLIIIDGRKGAWEFPGGGLDLNETFEECVIREVKEETGYNIKLTEKLPFHTSQRFSYFNSSDSFNNSIHFFFICELTSEIRGEQNLDNNEEILDVKWFNKEELKNLDFVPFQKEALKKYLTTF